MRKRTTSDPERTRAILAFLDLGFRDYIGARALLINGYCLQGAQLASTAVEKYLKAVMAFRGNSTKGHLGPSVMNSVGNYDPTLSAALNPTFIELLIRCYSLRYYDGIEPGFNIALASTNVLAELDYTVAEICKRISLHRSGKRLMTPYESAVQKKDPRLVHGNHLFMGMTKESFANAHPPHCFEMRLDPKLGLIEIEYQSEVGRWSPNFLEEGLRPGARNASGGGPHDLG